MNCASPREALPNERELFDADQSGSENTDPLGAGQTIRRLEQQISLLIRSERKAWKEAYRLLCYVQAHELWREGGHASYTAWLNYLSVKYDVSERSLWKTRAAGRVYTEYASRAALKGRAVPRLQDSVIQQDSLLYLYKMAQGNGAVCDELIEYATKNGITKNVIKDAWDRTRDLIQKSGGKALRKNGYDRFADTAPDIDRMKILRETARIDEQNDFLSDREILMLIHRYMGATVRRYSLEQMLREYRQNLD